MNLFRLSTLAAVLFLLALPVWSEESGRVVSVTDGDTLKVEIAGRVEKIRLIGVDTPETVHPNKPVEYFGKEASAFSRRMALGKVVRLEEDPETTNRDKYGRLLRYVFLPDGRLLNAEIIAQGYGHAYTRFPFTRMEEFRALERQAREGNRGLWGDTGAPAPGIDQGSAATATGTSQPDPAEIVYVTRTGTKYHRTGCRYLARSQIPVPLKEAAARYGPCSVCPPPTLSAAGASVSPAPTVTPPVAAGRCQAITKKGTQCRRNAAPGSLYCWQHQR